MDIKQCVHWIEQKQNIRIVNYGKQGKALKKLAEAGYTGQEVAECFDKMKEDQFWQDKIIDFMTIANNIHKYITGQDNRIPFQKEVDRNKATLKKIEQEKSEMSIAEWCKTQPENPFCRKYLLRLDKDKKSDIIDI